MFIVDDEVCILPYECIFVHIYHNCSYVPLIIRSYELVIHSFLYSQFFALYPTLLPLLDYTKIKRTLNLFKKFGKYTLSSYLFK
jgi:hypothetical protein